MYKTTFLDEASEDVKNACKWYSGQQDNLDEKFIKQLSFAIETLQSDKIIHGAVYLGLGRIFVKRFPYVIYFRKDLIKKQIIVFGVIHAKQSKDVLHKRL